MGHRTKLAVTRGGGMTRHYARCMCGWSGDLRTVREAAQRDADSHEHEAER